MEAKLALRVQRYGWDRAAELYERGWSEQLEPAQALLLELAALAPGERVLEAACGTGLVTTSIARALGPHGSVLATDISEGMLALAARRLAAEGLATVELARADLEHVEAPDGSFDALLCALGLMYAPDPAAALREGLRLLRPGGRAVFAVWGARERCGWAEIFPIVEARVASDVCPLFFRLGTQDALGRELRRAGFEAVESRRLETLLCYPDAASALVAAFAGGPVALAWSRLDEEARRGAERDYLASLEPYREGQGYAIPGEFVVALGRRPG